MKHHNNSSSFGRKRNARNGLMRSLVRALILEGRIVTTQAKAKALRPVVEKLITKGKVDSMTTLRLLEARTGSKEISKKIVREISPNYKERMGGYTRVLKLPRRGNDAAEMAVIELV